MNNSKVSVKSIAHISVEDGVHTFIVRDQNDNLYMYDYPKSSEPKPYTLLVLATTTYGDILNLSHSDFQVSFAGKKPYVITKADFVTN